MNLPNRWTADALNALIPPEAPAADVCLAPGGVATIAHLRPLPGRHVPTGIVVSVEPKGRRLSMTHLIDHLAELTGFRDRDQLDACVVRAVNDVLRPLQVAVFRLTGEAGDLRWLTRARMGGNDRVVSADPPTAELASLPALDAVPARAACLRQAQRVIEGHGPQTVCFPVATELEVVGVLELQTAAPLPSGDLAMVATIARIYGNFHGLLDHSERDPLTGLLNRQTFNTALMGQGHRERLDLGSIDADPAQANRRADAPTRQAWLGIVDIDHFKRVNDNFGHPIGDEVLLLLSRLMRSTFRHFDRLYRIGGEEFAVVLDCASAEQATGAFERLRLAVERFAFPQVASVTVSIGVTEAEPGETPTAAFARADKALYYVKNNGRNGVANFEALVRAGHLQGNDIVGDVELF